MQSREDYEEDTHRSVPSRLHAAQWRSFDIRTRTERRLQFRVSPSNSGEDARRSGGQVIQNGSNVDKTLRLATRVGRPTFRLAACIE
ncbi:hypothetical protein TNCT_207531, partial [Trichonephila clavata]